MRRARPLKRLACSPSEAIDRSLVGFGFDLSSFLLGVGVCQIHNKRYLAVMLDADEVQAGVAAGVTAAATGNQVGGSVPQKPLMG